MVDLNKSAYGAYERQRLLQILLDLCISQKDLSWSKMPAVISGFHGAEFSRQNLYRLKDPEKYGRLRDSTVEIIVRWVEKKFDSDIRERLKPQAIFKEMGKTTRDYYYHISSENVLDDWDENLLKRFSGVYLCQPAWDNNSWLPMSVLREWFKDYKSIKRFKSGGRTLDIKQYIGERSILILQRSESFYYNVAEFPLSVLFPEYFETACYKMVYEGVAAVSSNSINISLRECLSRVPKTISMLILPKTQTIQTTPNGFSFYVHPESFDVREDWKNLTEFEIEQMKREYADSIADEMYYAGPAQISLSPVRDLKSAISFTFGREYVFHPKPADFLREKSLHFISPELENSEELQKIIDNPLSMGEIL